MSEQPEDRYITVKEHQGIVDFYKKVVTHLYGTVKDLREELASQDRPAGPGEILPDKDPDRQQPQPEQLDNVIKVDFKQRSSADRQPAITP